MGRKIDIKKIDDVTKCQVTFSKRRSSVMKKANEIAVSCGVDVAFIAFSPSGRVSKFSNQTRIEDVIERYANLPNLELQIKKRELELQILETGLRRDYEPGPEQEPSLHQLCCASVRESILQDLVDGAKYAANENLAIPNIPNFSISSNLCDFASLQNPLEVTSSGVTHMSNQSLCNIENPRFASAMSVTTKASSMNDTSMLYTNSNSSQLKNTEGREIGKINMDSISIDTSDESQAPRHHKENFQDTLFDDILKEVNLSSFL
ncbi:PREDICTED: MADS-box transcription factor 25-like [Erythranthe guttata]|uniref:MADS-box transcription factor 25-like n=1 Tax=Erythranthe guttata TaxID=4155 RepID=UPI00064E124C|nr:PREDICTED: MADS-box transcription factor 25-like [Erythranthe guttata]|eukprot:XP_012853311.1 PREDICTED: MADS-box transcription factor 25-like [Erythranthe guttata]